MAASFPRRPPKATWDQVCGPWRLRLRHDWWEAAFIPVARLEIAEDGAVTYEVYEGALGVTPIP